MDKIDELEECGCCGYYHRKGYTGDCRNDKERYIDWPPITADLYKRIQKGLNGIFNLSPIQGRGLFSDDSDLLEPFFSKAPCDICNSELAGDRYRCIGTEGKKHTDNRIELAVCVDCYVYLFS